MDPAIYKAAISGDVDVLTINKGKLSDEMTQNSNTVLHLASQLGHADCVIEILKMAPSLLDKLNSRNETALHLAAQNGHKSVCEILIEFAKKVVLDTQEIESGLGAVVKEMMWMQNKEKDTALHLASRYDFHLVVELLTKKDPHHSHPANDAAESPLYVAASRGHLWVIDVILNNCISPSCDGPQGTTALHGAVISNSSAKLLEWDTSLTKKTDVAGQTPLHYGATVGYSKVVNNLMLADRSCAYIQDLDGKNTSLHLAASTGHTEVIQEILYFCPDLWDIVNGKEKRNILHIAIEQGHNHTAGFILNNCPVISSIINQKDADGNTPFHMIATSLCFVPKLIHHPLTDMRALNNKNLTLLDLVNAADYPPHISSRRREIVLKLKSAGATLGLHNSITSNQDCVEMTMQDDLNPSHSKSKYYAELSKMRDTHMIVAALVATVTFAAGFTLPCGYQGNEGPDLGLAILRKNTAYKVFVFLDTIALAFSLTAIGIYFNSTIQTRIGIIDDMHGPAAVLVQVSISAMLIELISGTYASLAPSNLAIATCIIGSILAYVVYSSILAFSEIWYKHIQFMSEMF